MPESQSSQKDAPNIGQTLQRRLPGQKSRLDLLLGVPFLQAEHEVTAQQKCSKPPQSWPPASNSPKFGSKEPDQGVREDQDPQFRNIRLSESEVFLETKDSNRSSSSQAQFHTRHIMTSMSLLIFALSLIEKQTEPQGINPS